MSGVDYFKWAQTTTNPKVIPRAGEQKPNQSLRKLVARLSSPKRSYNPYVNDCEYPQGKDSWMPAIKSPQKRKTFNGFKDV